MKRGRRGTSRGKWWSNGRGKLWEGEDLMPEGDSVDDGRILAKNGI